MTTERKPNTGGAKLNTQGAKPNTQGAKPNIRGANRTFLKTLLRADFYEYAAWVDSCKRPKNYLFWIR